MHWFLILSRIQDNNNNNNNNNDNDNDNIYTTLRVIFTHWKFF